MKEIYDSIYANHTDVWIDQGRSTDFQNYFAGLLAPFAPDSVLEVGCGEGTLLAALPGQVKYGIDPSHQALLRAKQRSDARCAVARSEELPYTSGAHNAVVAVGVMEHFERPDRAVSEIARVLAPGGHFFALIHTDMTRAQRLRLKAREYLWPPRPVALMRWIRKKLGHPINQPMRKSYTLGSATELLQRAGLTVKQVITRRTNPTAPLAGNHVLIVIAGKADPA